MRSQLMGTVGMGLPILLGGIGIQALFTLLVVVPTFKENIVNVAIKGYVGRILSYQYLSS